MIGLEHILRTGREISIFEVLIQCINSCGTFFWNQVIREWHGYIPIWKRSRDLGLDNQMAQEWENISTTMKLFGFI